MDSEEREIFYYLKTFGEDYVSGREIARRAGGKRKYHDDPEWAKPLLARMVERGVLQGDPQGRYRIKPVPKRNKSPKWVSPDIARILEENGMKVETGSDNETAPDDYYDQL
jgi:hypothetical protein